MRMRGNLIGLRGTSLLIGCIVGALGHTSAIGQTVDRFDIIGVELGADISESIEVVKRWCGDQGGIFNVAPKATPHPNGSKFSSGTSCLALPAKLEVKFNVTKGGDVVVEKIRYSLPSENGKAVTERALAKYGKPTNTQKNRFGGTHYEWCDRPVPAKSWSVCESSEGKRLNVFLGSVELVDGSFAAEEEKTRASRLRGNPSF